MDDARAPDDRRPAARGDAVRPLDSVALTRARRRLERDAPPWLHAEVARRMAERIALFRQPPSRVVDWWPTGGGATALRRALPHATHRALALDAEGAGPTAMRWWSPSRWRPAPARDTEASIGDGTADMVWANMLLHWAENPPALLRRWHAALAVDGLLLFSTVGPGTLERLRATYTTAGWGPSHAPFVDMHDLGDMLVAAGFADPVMDQETLTVTWTDAEVALRELRGLGANAAAGRFAGLRTAAWRAALADALPRDREGRVSLDFEVVYGHAVRPAPRVPVASRSAVGLEDMRSILRTRRSR